MLSLFGLKIPGIPNAATTRPTHVAHILSAETVYTQYILYRLCRRSHCSSDRVLGHHSFGKSVAHPQFGQDVFTRRHISRVSARTGTRHIFVSIAVKRTCDGIKSDVQSVARVHRRFRKRPSPRFGNFNINPVLLKLCSNSDGGFCIEMINVDLEDVILSKIFFFFFY